MSSADQAWAAAHDATRTSRRLTAEEKAARKQARLDAERAESRRLGAEFAAAHPIRPDEVPLLTRLIRGAPAVAAPVAHRDTA